MGLFFPWEDRHRYSQIFQLEIRVLILLCFKIEKFLEFCNFLCSDWWHTLTSNFKDSQVLLSSLSPEECCWVRDSLMTCPSSSFSFFLSLHIFPFASLNLSHLVFKEKRSEIIQGVSLNPLTSSIIVVWSCKLRLHMDVQGTGDYCTDYSQTQQNCCNAV